METIGKIETTLASILNKPGSIMKKHIEPSCHGLFGGKKTSKKLGKITIKCESPSDSNNDIKISLKAHICA